MHAHFCKVISNALQCSKAMIYIHEVKVMSWAHNHIVLDKYDWDNFEDLSTKVVFIIFTSFLPLLQQCNIIHMQESTQNKDEYLCDHSPGQSIDHHYHD